MEEAVVRARNERMERRTGKAGRGRERAGIGRRESGENTEARKGNRKRETECE